MLLDSTFLHDLVRGDPAADDRLEELIAAETGVALSPITIFEVGVGLRGRGAEHEQRFNDVVADLDVAGLGIDEARRAMSIQGGLYDRSEAIGARDVLIAGTALERGEDILTRNVAEFRRVDGLTVETY